MEESNKFITSWTLSILRTNQGGDDTTDVTRKPLPHPEVWIMAERVLISEFDNLHTWFLQV